ncbi:hypothetical protein N7457_009386 [Penicillium paradoxum]|uniref:uncharacterized protein n=1 Tax=Penicillium paradoxum TaxID=176176 RepID=UPI0025475392|nr:uncharacterized protein N7457_009386 [Penicillium paradoxum]KAJ5774490.1 hypothetical protein N7457_009386 [Penicillium paradoxum]
MLRVQFLWFFLLAWTASAGPISRWQSQELEQAPEPTSPFTPDLERRGGILTITPVAAPTQLPFTIDDPNFTSIASPAEPTTHRSSSSTPLTTSTTPASSTLANIVTSLPSTSTKPLASHTVPIISQAVPAPTSVIISSARGLSSQKPPVATSSLPIYVDPIHVSSSSAPRVSSSAKPNAPQTSADSAVPPAPSQTTQPLYSANAPAIASSKLTSSITPQKTNQGDGIIAPLSNAGNSTGTQAIPANPTSAISRPATQLPIVPTSNSPAAGIVLPANSTKAFTNPPVIPTSKANQPVNSVQGQSASAQLSVSTLRPVLTVTEPVIVYVTKGSPNPFSTSTIQQIAPAIISSSVPPAVPTGQPAPEPEPTTTSLVFMTIHSTATSVVRVTVYPTTSLPPLPVSLPPSSANATSVNAAPIETVHVTSTSIIAVTINATTLLPSSASPLPLSSEIAPTGEPLKKTQPTETVHITSTRIIAVTIYTSLPPSAASVSPSIEIAPTQNAPPDTVHVTSTKVVQVTVYPTTSASAAENTVPAAIAQATNIVDPKHPETRTSADADDAEPAATTLQPGKGILSVNPVTPAGFITITETMTQIQTTTVTDRVTETVTATVTRG